MSRRRNTAPMILAPVFEKFATELSATIERFTCARIDAAVRNVEKSKRPARIAQPRKRAARLCYAPGCKNVAAPRFGMFCAAEHKGLSKSQKKRYREQREVAQLRN